MAPHNLSVLVVVVTAIARVGHFFVSDINASGSVVEASKVLLVLHGTTTGSLPSILLPIAHPLGVAFNHVLRIGLHSDRIVSTRTGLIDSSFSSLKMSTVVGLAA